MPLTISKRCVEVLFRACCRSWIRLAILLTIVLPTAVLHAQQPISLMTPNDAWSFNNGQEFPGAMGSLKTDAEAGREGRAALKLVGDFTNGGGYVQAGRPIDGVDVRELSMWVRSPDTDRLTLRINDASGQTHQIVLRVDTGPDWQLIVLPLEQFFNRRGQADAVTTVLKYESWGGAKDGQWHGPAKAIYLLVSNRGANTVRELWLDDLSILPRPTAVPGAEIKTAIRLDEIVEGIHDWSFSHGAEFPGAKGSLTPVNDEPVAGQSCLKLAGDFTGGGAYVAAIRSLTALEAKDILAFRLRAKSANATSVGIQIVDGTGQTHQRRDMPIKADGQWHDLVLVPSEIAGGEHWGGANDGQWHGPARQLVVSLTNRSDSHMKQPAILLADIRAEALLPVFAQPAAFKADFETAPLGKTWTVTDGAAIDEQTAFNSKRSLVLSRSLDNVEKQCAFTGPAFAAATGKWEVRLACKADLHSPDNSYSGIVQLECLDATGKVVERFTVADVFGRRDWQVVSKLVELPKGAASARFQSQLNKTYGQFWLDDLSAAYLAPAPPRDDRIERMLFSTAQLGNLLYPDDSRQVSITVEARKPLRESQRTLVCVVRDYWGAEHTAPVNVVLGPAVKQPDRFVYAATLDLGEAPLEIGRYYELHAEIPQEGEEPFRNYTSLAILPEAATKRFKPEEVPFTARNWDNRITEYIRLTDRLGVRICGLWGGWSYMAPYKPEAPRIELVEELGMGWLTTMPIKFIEQGKYEYDEQALRQGVRNLIEQYGHVRPLIINLGNEPHGTGDRVLKNVAAYRAVYEEVKKVDPSIPVVATSVEPNEEYFRAGYGQWCDAYDFHIYEDSANVRRTIEEYRALAKKYGVSKPIWSTELGLNSQGLPRHRVAVELVKKFATFFAAGGENVSWFGLLYPDPQGKSFGSSGDSHNVFDCRYNRYCPRLDAVAYYHAVNSIAIKKFIEEKQYPGGVNAFLFRDRDHRSLQVLWKDQGRQDVFLPLPDVQQAQVIRIDGSTRTLHAGGKGITLSISSDPLLVIYDGGQNSLAPTRQAPSITFNSPPESIARHGPTTVTVVPNGVAPDSINLIAPPFWTVDKSPAVTSDNGQSTVRFTLHPPDSTFIREADLVVTLSDSQGNRHGELYYRAPVSD